MLFLQTPDGRQQLILDVAQVNEIINFTRHDANDMYHIPGQATTELAPFQKIIGVDPSAKMVEQANQSNQITALPGQLEYIQSSAEDLPFLKDGDVDLIVSGWQLHQVRSGLRVNHLVFSFSASRALVRLVQIMERGFSSSAARWKHRRMGER